MKQTTLFIVFAVVALSTFGQSESFLTLKEKFRGKENVFSLGTSGFVAKSILWAAGESEAKEVFRDVKHVRMMVIPKKAFVQENVTLGGFKKFAAREDHYEEILTIHEKGDNVSLLVQPGSKKKNNRYLLLVDDHSEIVALELVGYIDPDAVRKTYKQSYNYKRS